MSAFTVRLADGSTTDITASDVAGAVGRTMKRGLDPIGVAYAEGPHPNPFFDAHWPRIVARSREYLSDYGAGWG